MWRAQVPVRLRWEFKDSYTVFSILGENDTFGNIQIGSFIGFEHLPFSCIYSDTVGEVSSCVKLCDLLL